MIAIFKKDFRSYFRSMQTFVYLALFSLFCGYYACRQFFLAGADGSAASTLLSGMCAAAALLLPLITMRSFAGERILHTDHLVLTAPIGPLGLAFGKFLACAAFFALSLVPASILPLIIACMGYLSFGELFLVLLGCLLFGLAVAALGISAADSLTAVDPAHADEAGEVKIIKTSCRACIASCAVLAHVRDGRVVKIEGNPESPMSQGGVCAKGLAGIQALYHPNRNKYPMRRVGERGTNQWERISWADALTEVATKLNEVSDKYGSEAISVSTGGGGNPHFSNVKRFGEAINTPNVWEPGCSQCYLPRMGASLLAYGAGKPNNLSFSDSNGWDYYYVDSPVTSLVLWGTDPSNSSVATGGRALAELRGPLRVEAREPRDSAGWV